MFINKHWCLKRVQSSIEAERHIFIDGEEIKKEVKDCEYLGFVIDQNLSWNNQIVNSDKNKS